MSLYINLGHASDWRITRDILARRKGIYSGAMCYQGFKRSTMISAPGESIIIIFGSHEAV